MKSIIFGILLLIISFYIAAERMQLSVARHQIGTDSGIYDNLPITDDCLKCFD